jgi:hypothetical protein
MKSLIKNKFLISAVSVVLVTVLVVTVILLSSNKPAVPTENGKTASDNSSDISVNAPISDDTGASGSNTDTNDNGSTITVDIGTDSKPDTGGNSDTPSVQSEDNSQGGTKPPPESDDTVSAGNGDNTNSDPKTPDNPGDGVVSVDPVPRGEEPGGASGVKPKASDWVSVNSSIPQELYNYDYTVIDGEDLITGAQMKWRGYTAWDKAADAAKGGLAKYYTIDYRNIKSTNPNDRDQYLKDLVYWTSETAYMDICDYMKFAINNKIISTASVVTDGSLMYNNGVQLIRARVYVTFQSGASAYGLQNGVKYYKDVEVAVYASTGEDRYGFGKCNYYNVLLFSDNCFNALCSWKKA